jgi:hypothetical protein
MRRSPWLPLIGALTFGSVAACERGGQEDKVQSELQDLEEAREKAPQVTRDLEQQLAEAKKEVVRLEKKLALARQGITEEVIAERQQLGEALEARGESVREDIGQTREQATEFNEASERARKALQETQPGQVEAEVRSGAEVTPSETEVQGERVETEIPFETTREVERRETQRQQPPTSTKPAQPE